MLFPPIERASRGRARLVALAAALGVAAAACAASGGELGGAALRALGGVGLLGAAALALRRRPVPAAAGPLRLEARHALGRDTGVALVQADGRRLLVGFAPSGVSLVADLGPGEPR